MGEDHRPLIDPMFKLQHIRSTPNPQQCCWMAMHQDYCCDPVGSSKELKKVPDEDKAGEALIRNLLANGRGHFGVLEHPCITLNAHYFPHSTMQQLRTHRTGITFDVQSFRYTGQMIIDVATGERDVEEVFYVRPVGLWIDREGSRYEMTEQKRVEKLSRCIQASIEYASAVQDGEPYESARSLIPFDIRQHFVFTVNARSLMHLLDLRWKKDAQRECQWFCDLLFEHFQIWMPRVANWYKGNRKDRGLLAP